MAKNDIQELKSIIDKSRKIAGFTGAGISTESGIPDYRSKGGIWDKFKPVYFNEFTASREKQILYWQRKFELWDGIKYAKVNEGHLFFKDLYDKGKLIGLITQNIDGLHEKSGIPKESMINLHGNTLETICLDCKKIINTQEVFDNFDINNEVPLCSECNGVLKPNTISFGQQLIEDDLEKALKLSLECEIMIVMGSTLTVQPAANFPVSAKNNQAVLAIINLSETPLDDYADYLFNQKIGDFIEEYNSI